MEVVVQSIMIAVGSYFLLFVTRDILKSLTDKGIHLNLLCQIKYPVQYKFGCLTSELKISLKKKNNLINPILMC